MNDLLREQEATYEDISLLKSTINDIKRGIKHFEEKGIITKIKPLIINEDMIQIEKWSSTEVDMSNLSSAFQAIHCSNKCWRSMAGNNRYLLMEHIHLYVYLIRN